MSAITRRRALTGSAAVGMGVPLVAACGGADSTATAGRESPSGPPGQVLAEISDVPEGGCWVVTDAKLVVTQPSAGEFKAFSSTCTHQGCTVSSATEGVIPCRCHGSQFSLSDGSVVAGPATTALAEVEVTVDGDTISLA